MMFEISHNLAAKLRTNLSLIIFFSHLEHVCHAHVFTVERNNRTRTRESASFGVHLNLNCTSTLLFQRSVAIHSRGQYASEGVTILCAFLSGNLEESGGKRSIEGANLFTAGLHSHSDHFAGHSLTAMMLDRHTMSRC